MDNLLELLPTFIFGILVGGLFVFLFKKNQRNQISLKI
jgi:hypothetical protein